AVVAVGHRGGAGPRVPATSGAGRVFVVNRTGRLAMKTLRRIALVIAMLFVAGQAVPVLAQGQPKAKQPTTEERAYTIPYVATMLTIAIGIAASCMPSHRHWDIEMDAD